MANHISAKKRIRRNARRAAINGARMSRIRTFVKKVELAIAAGDADGAREPLPPWPLRRRTLGRAAARWAALALPAGAKT